MAKEKYNWTPIKEALKEAGRVIVFALISWGVAKLSTLPQTEIVMIGTILLRGIDKWMHKADKGYTENRGLLPF